MSSQGLVVIVNGGGADEMLSGLEGACSEDGERGDC